MIRVKIKTKLLILFIFLVIFGIGIFFLSGKKVKNTEAQTGNDWVVDCPLTSDACGGDMGGGRVVSGKGFMPESDDAHWTMESTDAVNVREGKGWVEINGLNFNGPVETQLFGMFGTMWGGEFTRRCLWDADKEQCDANVPEERGDVWWQGFSCNTKLGRIHDFKNDQWYRLFFKWYVDTSVSPHIQRFEASMFNLGSDQKWDGDDDGNPKVDDSVILSWGLPEAPGTGDLFREDTKPRSTMLVGIGTEDHAFFAGDNKPVYFRNLHVEFHGGYIATQVGPPCTPSPTTECSLPWSEDNVAYLFNKAYKEQDKKVNSNEYDKISCNDIQEDKLLVPFTFEDDSTSGRTVINPECLCKENPHANNNDGTIIMTEEACRIGLLGENTDDIYYDRCIRRVVSKYGMEDEDRGLATSRCMAGISDNLPKADIQLTVPSPEKNEEVSILFLRKNFNINSDVYSTYCIDGITQMGWQAGGRWLYTNDIENTAEEPRPCCKSPQRIPEEDEEDNGPGNPKGDGMDDNWEYKYFAGRTIMGKQYSKNKAILITEVNPGDDPDEDGLESTLKGKTGEIMTVVPNTAKGGDIGDGLFTNLEEYILGTDPVNPDTDNDGRKDGADVLGLDQSGFKFTNLKEPWDKYNVRSIAAGKDSLISKVTYIDSKDIDVFSGVGPPLQIDLSISPKAPYKGDKLNAEAQVLNADISSNYLNYEWWFDDIYLCDLNAPQLRAKSLLLKSAKGEFCGTGKSTFSLDIPKDIDIEIGQKHKLKVRITESSTNKEGEIEKEIMIGTDINLTYDPNCISEKPEIPPSCPVKGKEVTVTAEVSTLGKVDISKVYYEWYLDDKKQSEYSGVGKSIFKFGVTKSQGSFHKVELKLLGMKIEGEDGSGAIASKTIEIPVASLSVKLKASNETPSPGEKVIIEAMPYNFQSNPSFSYTWFINGKENNDVTGNKLEFTPSKNAKPGTEFFVNIRVRDNKHEETAFDSVKIVVSKLAVADIKDFSSLLAFASQNIPEELKWPLRIVLVVTAAFGIAFGVRRFIRK